MSDRMTIDVDTTALVAALDAIPAAVHAHLKAAAKVTAENIAREAKARFPRSRLAGLPTRGGMHTAEGVTVEETHSGDGYVVYVKSPEMFGLPGWLEFGTEKMDARPSLFPSARLEEGAHNRRLREAVQAAIDEKGLGE